MTVSQALEIRRAVPGFDPTFKIEKSEVESLINDALLSPSSMNLQPYGFLLAYTAEDKERLQKVSFNQMKVSQASAVIVVLGNMTGHLDHAEDQARHMVELGYFPESNIETWVARAKGAWESEQARRDECFRAGNIVGMSLMLLAQERGWNTGPMGGYVEKDLMKEFSLPENLIPVLVLSVGMVTSEVPILPRVPRYSAAELTYEGKFGTKAF